MADDFCKFFDEMITKYTLRSDRWNKLDEDVSFESFEYEDPEPTGISKVLLYHQ